MKKLLFVSIVLMFTTSCQKCYQCKQYCAYCISTGTPGVVFKSCASAEAFHYRIDSIRTAFQNNGYTCSMLDNDKRVCDGKNKVNDAINYYIREDYYCNPE